MVIGILVFIGLSLLILGHEAGHFFTARLFGMRVDEFGFGFPPRALSRRFRDTVYSVNWLPFGGFVRIAGEESVRADDEDGVAPPTADERKQLFSFQSPGRRAVVILSGVAANFVFGWLLFSAVFFLGTPRAVLITDVQGGSPAEAAGIERNDIVVGFASSLDLSQFIDERRGQEIELRVRRGGEEFIVPVVPREATEEGEGPIGVYLADAGVPAEPLPHAVVSGVRQAGRVFGYTLVAFGDLAKSLFVRAELPDDVAGPVGIFVIAQETGQLGIIYLLQLLAFISINLSVINLMPFPALDGGRAVMIALEKIRGAPISLRAQAFVNTVGFAFLLFLIFSITVSDVAKLLWTA